jgi:hypothetical protein
MHFNKIFRIFVINNRNSCCCRQGKERKEKEIVAIEQVDFITTSSGLNFFLRKRRQENSPSSVWWENPSSLQILKPRNEYIPQKIGFDGQITKSSAHQSMTQNKKESRRVRRHLFRRHRNFLQKVHREEAALQILCYRRHCHLWNPASSFPEQQFQ